MKKKINNIKENLQEKYLTKTMICKKNVITELENLKVAIKDLESKTEYLNRLELNISEKLKSVSNEVEKLIKYTGIELNTIKGYVEDLDKQFTKLKTKVELLYLEKRK